MVYVLLLSSDAVPPVTEIGPCPSDFEAKVRTILDIVAPSAALIVRVAPF